MVALVQGSDATLKRFYREGDKIRLQPSNAKMKPIIVDSGADTGFPTCRVLGLEVLVADDEAGGEVLGERRLAERGADAAAEGRASEGRVLRGHTKSAEASELLVSIDPSAGGHCRPRRCR